MERTSRMGSKRNLIFYIGIVFICFIYLALRLSFPETIEFGYDQPRLATRVIEFIQNGKILDTQKFAERAPWGNISWGPALFYFYTPFLILTKNPLAISYLVSIFNLLSIVGVIYLTSINISKKAGLFAGLILATQSWWVIFSRMIYQPTPVITLVVISMILFFKTIKKPNSFYYSLLIFSWIFLAEIYFHTISFVLISLFLLLIYSRKKIFNKFMFFGILLSTLLIVPFFINLSKSDYFPLEAQSSKDMFTIGRDDPITRIKNITPGFIKTFSGGSMEYQLGYSTSIFYKKYTFLKSLEITVIYLTVIVFLYNLIRLIISTELRFERSAFLLWSLSPFFFLVFMPLSNVPPIPRYFLISFPSIAILYGIFFSEIYKYSKLVLVLLIAPVFWIYFTFCYSKFIKDYDFPSGHLSVYSDTQYLFLFNAIKSARGHNISNNRKNIVISNDENLPKEFALDYSTRYVLSNVFNKVMTNGNTDSGYYLIDYSLKKDDIRFRQLGRFGPYSVYEFKDL